MSDDTDERARARVGLVLRNKYRIDQLLGVGGMAAVYSASHRNGRQVAVKLLHPELSLRSDIRKRFLREAQAANAIHHDGVVNVIDDDVAEDGAAFLVMELLRGRSVEDLWTRSGGRLSAATVLAIARELAEVLVVAHRAGVVHRDIKPANLFITSDNRLKVLDFGIARVRDFATTHLTDTGMLLGTPAFMAPEQAQGRVSEIDERTDLWAIGATMFTLFSGRVVHEGETAQHMTILAATQPARSLAVVAPDAPPELVEIVDRALALDKSHRWQGAKALQRAVLDVCERLFGDRNVPLDYDAFATTRERTSVPPNTTDRMNPMAYPARVRRTTSSPVSNSPLTERRHQRPAWSRTLPLAPFARTLASAFQSVRSAIVRDSPHPPAGEHEARSPELEEPRRRERAFPQHPRSRAPLGILFLTASLLTAAAVVAVTSRDFVKPPTISLPASVAPSTSTVPEPIPQLVPPPVPQPSATTTAEAPGISLDDDAPPTPTSPPRQKWNAHPPTHAKPSPQPKAAPSPSPTQSSLPRPDCNPPYTLDERGDKHFKSQCPL